MTANVSRTLVLNLLRLRRKLGLTQTDVAREMKKRGFPYYQQTVARIEDEERPVRIDEAVALASVFGQPLNVLIGLDDSPLATPKVDNVEWAVRNLNTDELLRVNALVADLLLKRQEGGSES